jgi:Cu(I)/Ag(I) efflux system membrane fusion protein
LSEGEEVVTSGAFALDASAQLAGQASMMNGDAASKTATPAIEAETPVIEAKTPLVAASLTVQGLCGMCRQRIETTAAALSGVSSAEWDAETKRLLLRHDPSRASLDAISRALAAVGHDTNLHKAPHDVYNALPACCKYREE